MRYVVQISRVLACVAIFFVVTADQLTAGGMERYRPYIYVSGSSPYTLVRVCYTGSHEGVYGLTKVREYGYTFCFSDEAISPLHRKGTEDCEPVNVAVDVETNRVIAVWSRPHGLWISYPILPWLRSDWMRGDHIVVGFETNYHTPIFGRSNIPTWVMDARRIGLNYYLRRCNP